MKPHRKKRLTYIAFATLSVLVAVGLVLYALRQNIQLYLTPTQVVEGHAPLHRVFRMGGMVKVGSVKREKNGLNVHFTLTDFKNNRVVVFNGVLPALFREGQGIVAEGRLNKNGEFIADTVLAKHDEKYMPPGIFPATRKKNLPR